MNKKEKVRYEQKLADYLEKNKVQDTFHYLFRQLLLQKPDDPLTFLIEELRRKRKMRLIFFSGYAKTGLNEIAASVCARMNFKHISYFDYIKKAVEDGTKAGKSLESNYLDSNMLDNELFDKLVFDLQHVARPFIGCVLEGFPNNITQLLYLTKRGLIPNRFFYINYGKEKDLQDAKNFLKTNSGLYLNSQEKIGEYLKSHREVTQLNVKEMKNGFPQMVTDINASNLTNAQITSQIESILSPKARAVTPLRSPQVLVLSLISSISNPIIQDISAKFGLVKICAQNLINKEIARKSVLGHYCQIAREQGFMVPDDVYCTLTQNEVRQTHSQHLGWVMDGFPCTKAQLNKFISWRCPPQIILILNASLKYLNKRAQLIRYDPSTKKTYNLSKTKVSQDLLKKLVILPAHTPEKLQQRLDVFNEMIGHMKEKFSYRMQILDIEKTQVSAIHKKIKDMIEDPQYYS